MRVDLPAPFSPNRTWTSPARSSKSTPSSAVTPGYSLTMRRHRTSGSACCAVPSGGIDPALLRVLWLMRNEKSGTGADARSEPWNPLSVDAERRLERRRGQRGLGVERLEVRLINHEQGRPNVLVVVLVFEDAHRLIDGDPT